MCLSCASVSCVCQCACVTFVVFTDCESCTRPISTNPGSMEAGKCGLTRGTCFAARRLELVAVAERLWIWWCVLGWADFFRVLFALFPSNEHGLLQVRGHLASCTSLLVTRILWCFYCGRNPQLLLTSRLLLGGVERGYLTTLQYHNNAHHVYSDPQP